MKNSFLTVLILSTISLIIAFPIEAPGVGDRYSYPDFNIHLVGDRVLQKASVICADSSQVYIFMSSDLVVSIPRVQVVSIEPELPSIPFVFSYYKFFTGWDGRDLEIATLGEATKYVLRSRITDIDMFGGVTVSHQIYNLTDFRLKYVIYDISYYNAVDDLVYDEIGRDSSQKCKATGYIEPGRTNFGHWSGFYNTTAKYINLSSMTVILESDHKETIEWDDPRLLLVEN